MQQVSTVASRGQRSDKTMALGWQVSSWEQAIDVGGQERRGGICWTICVGSDHPVASFTAMQAKPTEKPSPPTTR